MVGEVFVVDQDRVIANLDLSNVVSLVPEQLLEPIKVHISSLEDLVIVALARLSIIKLLLEHANFAIQSHQLVVERVAVRLTTKNTILPILLQHLFRVILLVGIYFFI